MEHRDIYAVVYVDDYEGDHVNYHGSLESAVEQKGGLRGAVVVTINTSPDRLTRELDRLGKTAREILAEQEEG